MTTCRTALRLAARHPFHIFGYLVALTLLSMLVTVTPYVGESGASREAYRASVAVVDRDGSELSGAFEDHLGDVYALTEVEDDAFAMQDALAQRRVDCLFVVPEGYGEGFARAARSGGDLPEVEVAFGTDTQAAAVASSEARSWLSLLARAIYLQPHRSLDSVVERVDDSATEHVDAQVTAAQQDAPDMDVFKQYLGFTSYSLFVTIVVVAGLVFSRFRLLDVRRRVSASPARPARTSLSLIGAGLVLVLVAWAFVSLVGVASCWSVLKEASAVQVGVSLFALLLYALIPLALVFTVAQFNVTEETLHALGNIGGLAISFLGGAWIPLSLVSPAVVAVAHFTPMYWINDAFDAIFGTGGLGGAYAARAAGDLGIVALFAVATATVGVAVSRARRREGASSII